MCSALREDGVSANEDEVASAADEACSCHGKIAKARVLGPRTKLKASTVAGSRCAPRRESTCRLETRRQSGKGMLGQIG